MASVVLLQSSCFRSYALPNYLLSGLLTYSILLTLPRSLTFTPAQFTEVSAANPEVVLELATNGTVIELKPPATAQVRTTAAHWLSLKTGQRTPTLAGSCSPAP
jgi:hypothetical protein